MFDITACLLTYNEAHWIDLCIEHIYDYVKEIVCLDAGSTDDTVEILKQYGKVRYYIIPQPSTNRGCDGWNEGDRRNILEDTAKTEWIMCLGCDELFDDELWENLPNLLTEDFIGIGFYRINYFYNFKYHKPIHQPPNGGEVRIYRNIPEIKWETNNAHNFLRYSDDYCSIRMYDHPKVINTKFLIHHLHRVGIRDYKPLYDRRRPGSFIHEEDIKHSSEFLELSDKSYFRPIKLPKILKNKNLI